MLFYGFILLLTENFRVKKYANNLIKNEVNVRIGFTFSSSLKCENFYQHLIS